MLGSAVARIAEIIDENYSVPAQYDPIGNAVLGSNVFTDGEQADEGISDAAIADKDEFVSNAEYAQAVAASWIFVDEITLLDYKKLVKLNQLLKQQLNRISVSNVMLSRVLSVEQYKNFESSLVDIRHMSEANCYGGMPAVLKRYVRLVHQADFAFWKTERRAVKILSNLRSPNRESISKGYRDADKLYESALENLEELFSDAEIRGGTHELESWLDRKVIFGEHNNLNLDCDSIPRIRGSKSHQAQDAGLPKLSVRLKREECIIIALLSASTAIVYVPELNAEVEISSESIERNKNRFKNLSSHRSREI